MPTGTVRLHRVLRAKPDKVYRAFLDAGAVARWLPPNGFICTVDHLDAKVGGTFRMAFRNFTTGNGHSFGGTYLDLAPGERIRYTDKFDDPNLSGEMITSVKLREVQCGCEIDVVQEGIPEMIPTEFCYLGWQESLEHLARLVEPEIPELSAHHMKYLCLAYEAEEIFKTMPREVWLALREETLAYVEALSHSGQLLDARPLRSARTAATLRVRNGALSVTDGPFAETKEQLGGYFLIEARDLNEAIQLAAKWPGARYGQIEVRPVEEGLPEAEGRYPG